MLVRIDPESDAPLFAQVADSVRADAAAGRVRAGDRLPAARDIAGALGINVHTVLHAYQDLRDEGLVELRRGRGAVVTEQASALAALHHDIQDLVARARATGLHPDALAALVKEIARDH
ncbi:GntR family transcriptional regulator [Microbacterium allomyrinae]|jgi:GntR family transcriptional regulator|uniref:GntR family transcriptional regulator n=1 Tax=Microbacterium allomyrinae TaxID=2830666 RepID=A0A9X1LSF5_9MICO|nr:GntR family transcriptional regulator [Microbacterium allomyrinae]MCC2030695.1 GntR family transcriptional regulator [Microbacterium allomyrinae]